MRTERLLQDQMLRVLGKAQELRSQKQERLGNEPEWIIYERKAMFEAVNAVRLQRDRAPITIEAIRRVEGCAAGHVDYSQKFALYCVELALQ